MGPLEFDMVTCGVDWLWDPFTSGRKSRDNGFISLREANAEKASDVHREIQFQPIGSLESSFILFCSSKLVPSHRFLKSSDAFLSTRNVLYVTEYPCISRVCARNQYFVFPQSYFQEGEAHHSTIKKDFQAITTTTIKACVHDQEKRRKRNVLNIELLAFFPIYSSTGFVSVFVLGPEFSQNNQVNRSKLEGETASWRNGTLLHREHCAHPKTKKVSDEGFTCRLRLTTAHDSDEHHLLIPAFAARA
ncbi:hypothetical protein BDP27DRAFT_1397971 [Rhodocollybia butyracea]|uniref:Uncharacterized protein n=1 Tax=Rhodocollybia butyracea TaxID=206335 RepID=A0A9P5UF61_9AGAR|nr:hypothetical protein BDP27DRAFT_1397971 [Rhodocollybia butyracea]